MKFQIVATILTGFATIVSAVPTPRTTDNNYQPDAMVQIHEATPETAHGLTSSGKISRTNGMNNVQTLVSIPIPDSAAGKTCSMVFNGPATASGSQRFQVFTVGDNKAIDGSTTFYSRPYRDQHMADFHVSTSPPEFVGYGLWNTNKIPCPAGKRLNFELVPMWDYDEITWDLPNGFAIESS